MLRKFSAYIYFTDLRPRGRNFFVLLAVFPYVGNINLRRISVAEVLLEMPTFFTRTHKLFPNDFTPTARPFVRRARTRAASLKYFDDLAT